MEEISNQSISLAGSLIKWRLHNVRAKKNIVFAAIAQKLLRDIYHILLCINFILECCFQWCHNVISKDSIPMISNQTINVQHGNFKMKFHQCDMNGSPSVWWVYPEWCSKRYMRQEMLDGDMRNKHSHLRLLTDIM